MVGTQPVSWLAAVPWMFLPGGLGRILGDSLYLWVVGNNVEDGMGRGRFVGFYLLTGVTAALAHLAVDPTSPVPTAGASGAIPGIMGAYLVRTPRVRVRTLIPPFFRLQFPTWPVQIPGVVAHGDGGLE